MKYYPVGSAHVSPAHHFVVGFGRDSKTKQPNVTVEVRVLEQNRPVNEKPLVVTLAPGIRVPEDLALIDFKTQLLPLNRAGTFTIEIKADCKVTGKTDKITFPITVTAIQK